MAHTLHVVVASTRPGRKGLAVARWFEDFARQHGDFDPVLVDLAEFDLPVYDEPEHPLTRRYQHEHTKRWSASVAKADAYAFVMPEYNYFPPPSLVNALSYLVAEWTYKPAGLVSYGGVSGGLRAAQAVKLLLTTLKIMPIPEGVAVPNFATFMDDAGTFRPNELVEKSATTMLGELIRWSGALKPMRAP
ncbi:NADPH-dependent oxidoreductase [Roseomonas nepalensis]|uniref:NADPH-dependent oxidoreductase n=1 Tax=Muricoccus nepalensis TaxID=1854500 RepID=A0A502F9J4_9PROT|nr:NAD(P)H-dependent oxidoreductase [Roseomonas nepalensis]TPG46027.1 NADPH-dependent oxidoreductase [Roseomonas nepalensis]